jgi:hypothetical protein
MDRFNFYPIVTKQSFLAAEPYLRANSSLLETRPRHVNIHKIAFQEGQPGGRRLACPVAGGSYRALFFLLKMNTGGCWRGTTTVARR